ncbi:phosphoglycerate kinase [Candidatus Peregrinibacteria bacterium]|nr:phosphoglycerate kinase [Candidatus Peregrinibacteria bacterium]
MKLRTVKNLKNLKGKRVIVRVDFNVPLDSKGNVRNDKRIRFALPTLKYLLAEEADQLILMTHVGRPKNNEKELMTGRIAERLGKLIKIKVAKVNGWGEKGIPPAKIVMLENLRFNPGEKSKNENERAAFGKQLASLADIYVNEAFSNSHRAHASMVSVPKFIPGYAGFGVMQEAEQISKALVHPKRPVVAIMAGVKADKLNAIKNMMKIADQVCVGGALAYALRKVQGYGVGATKIDQEGMTEMADIVKEVSKSRKVILPVDAVVADKLDAKAKVKIVPLEKIPNDAMALDIGPKTIKQYADIIKKAKTVLWFGPLGAFESAPFAKGTKAIGSAIAKVKGLTIAGGGDTATAIEKFKLEKKFTLVSTGGGASLEMIEGKELPGLSILKK